VQQQLAQAGVYRGRADGVWGPDSETALQQYQSTHGLLVTGELNPATARMLGLDPAQLVQQEQQAAAAPYNSGTLSPDAVRAVQSRLGQLGFYRGAADGVWGPGTQQAIAQFQESRGLQPNSQLNPATVNALGLPPEALAAR
jgi:peptidoglycan hydrolase-like protein with peptidoglycan-binding domain